MAKRKLLIVDDDIVTLNILKKHLEETYDVRIEDAGYRFVQKIEEYDFDLLLLDIEMPVMNGLEVFEKYREYGKKNAPVIFLTGVANPQVVRDVMGTGAKGYIIKSCGKSELIRKIDQVFLTEECKTVVKRVLVIHEDLEFLTKMKRQLKEKGFDVKLSNSVLKGLEFLKKSDADVIVVNPCGLNVSNDELYSYFNDFKDKLLITDENDVDSLTSKVVNGI